MSQALTDISPDTTGTRPPKSIRHLVALDETGKPLEPVISLCGRNLKSNPPSPSQASKSVKCEPCWIMFDLMNSLNS